VPPDDSLMFAPQFTTQLANKTVKDGEQVELSCTVKGDPDPQISWLKDGQVSSSPMFLLAPSLYDRA